MALGLPDQIGRQVAAADPGAELRAVAGTVIRPLRWAWESEDRRRDLPPDLVR